MARRYSAAMWVYLNNDFVPQNQAMVPMQDRGFRYGDGVFETIRIQSTVPLHFHRHQERLASGLKALSIEVSIGELPQLSKQLIAKNQIENGILRIAVSRGVGGRGYLPDYKMEATIVIETLPLPSQPAAPKTLWLSSYKKVSSHALPTHLKLSQGINSILAAIEARGHRCDDALLLNDDGYICETSNSNLFWRKDNQLFTPSSECGALEGITRQILCEYWQDRIIHTKAELEGFCGADAIISVNSITGATAIQKLKVPESNWNSLDFAEQANVALNAEAEKYIAAHADHS